MIASKDFQEFETRVLGAARTLSYPSTPDIVGAFAHRTSPAQGPARRLAYALAIVLVTIAALLAVPEVRARILEFFQIGGVRIELPEATPTVEIPEAANELEQYGNLISVSNLTGETTLDEIREIVDFDIPLPAYPAFLGEPDHSYLQRIEPGQYFVIMAWMQTEESEQVEIALYVIGPGITLTKGPVEELQATSVNGHPAAYIRGMHYLQVDRLPDYGVLVQAPALIWEAGGITYRIEADLPLEELVQIAESLKSK